MPPLTRALALTLCFAAAPALADRYAQMQARRPDLFDPATGYRIARQRAPTPDDIPGPAAPVDADTAAALLDDGALPLDVFGALQSRYDELDGAWPVAGPRLSLPGALWLPEVGRGRLDGPLAAYLATALAARTTGPGHPIVVFCVADCWMSWNAAQRVAGMGYTRVFWFRLGTDGWRDSGRPLAPVLPLPVAVD